MTRLTFLFSIISAALFALPLVHAAPFEGTTEALSPTARNVLSTRDVTAAPRWVAYFDKWISDTSLPTVSDLSIKTEYAAAGISLVVSAFGSTYLPTTVGDDPTAAANYIANFVKEYNLDGVDVDYEDFTAVETAGTAVAWLTTFTTALRAQLPAGQYILTHAPVAPWFSPGLWANDVYLGLDSAVGSLIDWYNIQFYNQGATEYTTCDGLLTTSSTTWPESAVFQIAANGVSLNKLVIGKPATTADAGSRYMDPATLSTCLVQAAAQGWSAGAMTWQYPNGGSAWITEVRAGAFAMGATAATTSTAKTTSTTATPTSMTTTSTVKTTSTSTTPTSTSATTTSTSTTTTSTSKTASTSPITTTSTSTPTGTSCSGVAAWANNVAYQSGASATYRHVFSLITSNLSYVEAYHLDSGSLWTATEWNYNEVPEGSADAWHETATC
ncbi:glycoside hydrolase [Mycena sanguinolenta]|nr:glycoside hydrolase [Mycena sanguinolenta]